jgi:hyperosmotically inducible protein
MKTHVEVMAIAALLAIPCVQVQGADHESNTKSNETRVQKEVRHELITLSRYGVFDNIAYRVDGQKVTLFGQVTQPVLKDDAGKAVRGIEGIESVDNEIEVLPLSANDDSIRRDVYRRIYSQPALERYQFGAVPPIHIIVKNGNITLEGVVGSEMDKDLAGLYANGAPGAFQVTNNLRVEG